MGLVDAGDFELEVRKLRRPAWVPITDGNTGVLTCSKFGGRPLITKACPWPTCGNCGKALQHFLQLNLKDLPEDLDLEQFGFNRGLPSGLLQFFFCTSEEPDPLCFADTYGDAFASSHLVRFVEIDEELPEDVTVALFDTKAITGWQLRDDFPTNPEYSRLFNIDPYKDVDDELSDRLYEERITLDKLLGWPAWEQESEYQECLECGSKMIYFFQIDSEDHVPFMFGDAGRGQIHICSVDNCTAFTWASG